MAGLPPQILGDQNMSFKVATLFEVVLASRAGKARDSVMISSESLLSRVCQF